MLIIGSNFHFLDGSLGKATRGPIFPSVDRWNLLFWRQLLSANWTHLRAYTRVCMCVCVRTCVCTCRSILVSVYMIDIHVCVCAWFTSPYLCMYMPLQTIVKWSIHTLINSYSWMHICSSLYFLLNSHEKILIICSEESLLFLPILRWDCCWNIVNMQWRWECGWRKVGCAEYCMYNTCTQ